MMALWIGTMSQMCCRMLVSMIGSYSPPPFLYAMEQVLTGTVESGQDPSSLSQFFPPGSPQTINFPTFLNILSTLLDPLSSRQELVNALAAFDEDDSGQIDVHELRDALLHTAPEDGERPLSEREIDQVLSGFTGRRAFGAKMSGGSKRGDVFKYHEFVDGIMGGTTNNATPQGRAQS